MVRLVEERTKLTDEKLEAARREQGEQLVAVTRELVQLQRERGRVNVQGLQEHPGAPGPRAAISSGVPSHFKEPEPAEKEAALEPSVKESGLS